MLAPNNWDFVLQVLMNVVSSGASWTGYERSGQLIQPPGFERLLAVLTYIPLDEFAGSEQLHHLIQMTVAEPSDSAPWQYFSTAHAFKLTQMQRLGYVLSLT